MTLPLPLVLTPGLRRIFYPVGLDGKTPRVKTIRFDREGNIVKVTYHATR